MYEFLSSEILEKYADLMVNFASRSRKGIQKGDVVMVQVPECASIMLKHFQVAILKSGGYPMLDLIPDGLRADFYKHASDDQINFVPEKLINTKVDLVDQWISVIANNDPMELKNVDSKKIMQRQKVLGPIKKARFAKFNKGLADWTLCMFGTPAMAEQAGLSLKEYWDEIINACFLDHDDPIGEFQNIFSKIDAVCDKLNQLEIESIHLEGQDCDLRVKIGANRKWVGGSGHNIPSFECFTSPDFRGTQGWMRFNQPLYRNGSLIKGIELHFEDGKITKATAEQNQEALEQMISVSGANQLGEFSLTDADFSRIRKFMANTLYDENTGGEHGNTHVAIGSSYRNCYKGNPAEISEEQWQTMGYNESAIHTDIVSTVNRTATATLQDGSTKVIYKDGHFCLD